ncbi:MAG: ABC transporter permease, partial [Clostridia bacterium]|nr:ABC transporter permease [Clostridia bacterium]
YISIVLIAFLAVTCFTGIRFGAKGLSEQASKYYDGQNFRDFEVISAVLFSDEDLKAISEIDGVADVEGMLRTTGKLKAKGNKSDVAVLSLTERINVPELIEGEFPKNADECAIEKDVSKNFGISVGDRITIEDTGSEMKMLLQKEYTVTGIVIHPDHLVTPNSFGDYVILPRSSFDSELLSGRSIYAEVVIDKPVGIDRGEDEYFSLIKNVSAKIEKLSADQSSITLNQLWQQLESYKKTFRDDVFKSLIRKIVMRVRNFSEEEADRLLDMYDWAEERINIDLADKDLDASVIPILADFGFRFPEKENLVDSIIEQLDAAAERFSDFGLDKLKIKLPDNAKAELQQFIDGLDMSNYDKLTAAITLWNRGHTRYITTLDNLAHPETSSGTLDGIWLIFDAKMNAGYMHMSMSVSGIAAISMRFTLLFIIVGAIVIYSTIGKLVDEQKKLVGTTKAFGFFNREILGKYLIFGGSATFLGTILGILGGYFLLQYFVDIAYGRYYIFGTASRTVIIWQLFVILAASLLLAFLAVWVASTKLLRSPAVSLMKDDSPVVKKKAKKTNKSRLSLYNRLIIRNIRTDAKRVLVTVVSIAGSGALILIGFSVYFSVNKTVKTQFDDLVRYDSYVYFDEKENADAESDITALLQKVGAAAIPARVENGAFRSGSGTEPANIIVADISKLKDYIVLKDPGTGTELGADSGVFIPSSYANTYGLKKGDECILMDSSGTAYKAKVGGIFESYLGTTVVLGKKGYAEVLGKEVTFNALLAKHDGIDRVALDEKLKSVSGYDKIKRSDDMRVMFNGFSDLIAVMMIIIITAAGLLSAVILTNLINICILQKKRELTVMRVNGFTTKEVKNYITREAIFTTAVGIVLGTILGLLQFRVIMPMLGKSYTTFIMTPDPIAILISAAVTILFTVIIYHFALRKVNDLKLTDIA